MKLQQAQQIANEWRELLAPYCKKIEVAGSIRRQAPEVNDIELVAIPKPRVGFYNDIYVMTVLDSYLHRLNQINPSISIIKDGEKYKQLSAELHNLKIDLFLVTPPAQWGSIFAIRTGPAKYSKWLVTSKQKGGARPSYMDQREGALWNGDETIETPTEKGYFDALGIDYVEPKDRIGFGEVKK